MHYSTEEGQRALLALPPEHARAAVEHAQTLDEAALLMLHRTGSYGLVWQRFGALSNLLNAARKVERLMESWWAGSGERPALHKDNLDDAFDAINYLTFFIQCAREGNLTGENGFPGRGVCVVHVVPFEEQDCLNCGASLMQFGDQDWTAVDRQELRNV